MSYIINWKRRKERREEKKWYKNQKTKSNLTYIYTMCYMFETIVQVSYYYSLYLVFKLNQFA
jgi:hypothetical protein